MPGAGVSLFALVESYRRRGLATPFAVRPGGHVLCGACRRENPAGFLRVLALDRTASIAPGENLAVAALQCASCAERGTLPLTYGPRATAEDDQVFAALHAPAAGLGLGHPLGGFGSPDAAFA